MDKKTIKLSNILMDYKLDIIPLNEAENRILLLCDSSSQLKAKETMTFEVWRNKMGYTKVYDNYFLNGRGYIYSDVFSKYNKYLKNL